MPRWLLLLVPLALWLLYGSLYAVDAAEFAYVTQFGQPVAIYDGGDPAQAGLKAKLPWPIQSVQRLDRRLQAFDLPPSEFLTSDKKGGTIDRTLTIDATVCWRIAGADRFVRTVGSIEGAQRLLSQRVSSDLGAAIGQREMDDLVSVEPGRVQRQREELRASLMSVGDRFLGENGIEIIDIRLRRANHPQGLVREAIFERIRSERSKKAAEYSSAGQLLADDIRSKAEREVAVMKAQAEGRALELRGQAEAEADRLRFQAQQADPKFYAFLRKLEDYRKMIGDGKSTLLLSTHREMFDLLFAPPGGKEKR